jgi:6-pyruvoyltetrahydropterin/6-carboxytetrahydropterin synthase
MKRTRGNDRRADLRWTLSKEFTFEAAHRLPRHDGKCARLHGHSWKMLVEVESPELHKSGPKSGMVMDFGDIKAAVEKLKHRTT